MGLGEEISKVLAGAGLEGKGILVALSGGVDSATLLRVLCSLGCRVEAAHVDHGLRDSSASDARFCRELAEELGAPFHLLTLTGADFPPGENVQAAGRDLRRSFLERTMRERGLDAIALAHHADDQAETVLFRLMRGAGPRGVCGMSPWEDPYLRPLLGVGKAKIERYASENHFSFREDPTNRTPKYSRNRIRRELLPLAREICPGADGALLRFSSLARRDEEYLTGIALGEFARLARPEPEGMSFSAAALEALPSPIRLRLFLAAFRSLGEDTSLLSSVHLEGIEELLEDGKPYRRAPSPGGVSFARSYDRLWVLRKKFLEPSGLFDPSKEAGARICQAGKVPEDHLFAGLPAGRPSGDAYFRLWEPGDRVSGRKVKDILMEAGVERWRRPLAVVAGDGEGLFALFAPGEPGFAAGTEEKKEKPAHFAVIRAGWWKDSLKS